MRKIVLNSLEQVAAKTLECLNGPNIAVSGGSTYEKLFDIWRRGLLSREPEVKKLQFFPVDERLVAFDQPGNNWRVAFDRLFAPLGIREQKDHMAVSAQQYRHLLKTRFGDRVVFDQVFLGMGDDGHTASLFPGGSYLDDKHSLVLETRSPKPPVERVTLGLKPIWDARTLVAVALGSGKAPMVERLLAGDSGLPITLALGGHPDPILILDKAAAGEA